MIQMTLFINGSDMKKKLFGQILRILISVMMMTGIFYHSYDILRAKFASNEAYDGSNFRSLPKDSIDIIVLGSSHAQYSFVPSFMYQDTGLYSYVLGSACQQMSVSYQMLKEALKTQSPEMVIIEIYTVTPAKEECDADGCIVLASYQMTGQERKETLDLLPEEKATSYYNTFINEHNNWKNIEDLRIFLQNSHADSKNNFGYVYNSYHQSKNNWYPNIYEDEEYADSHISESDLNAINNIYSLCQEKDIDLLLYMVPHENISEEDQTVRYELWKWAEERGIKYQDYVKDCEDIYYHIKLHGDGYHSFLNGAALITDNLAKFIMDNYEFSSHEVNETIEKALKANENLYMLEVLRTEHNPEIYLRRLHNYDGTIIFRYNAWEQLLGNSFIKKLKDLGISTDFDSYHDYFAIIKDGEIIAESEDDLSYVDEIGHEYDISSKEIWVDGRLIDGDDPLSIVIFNEDFSDYVIKHTQRVEPSWDNDSHKYWERDYNRFYALDED